jgi:hypothetical protein
MNPSKLDMICTKYAMLTLFLSSFNLVDLPAKSIAAPSAPPPQPNPTQLLEIKENLNEQQQQQQQQQAAAQVPTNMGPSGTGTYC